MSAADELLNALAEADTSGTADEEHIVIGRDKVITIPESLKDIGVQFDNNIETVTFDCPRYWDGHDLSTMEIYVIYLRADGIKGKKLCTNVVTDKSNPDIMHFDWTVTQNATLIDGKLRILVCMKKTDSDGNEVNHWNSKINDEMYISEGMECDDTILEQYPDIITDLLTKMDDVLNNGVSDEQLSNALANYFLANPITETDPTVPSWAKQSTKPTYTAEEVGALPDSTYIPTKTSDLENTSEFITAAVSNLINYYKKSEVYNQEEINQMISSIPKFDIKVVAELPTSNISTTTIYLVPYGDDSNNLYTEYIYVNSIWEILGTQSIDLSDYALKSEIPSEYTLPIASPTQPGGVQPVAKTDEMTQEVGVDEVGGLWSMAGGGSDNLGDFRLINEITVEEECTSVNISTDSNGEPFELEEFIVRIYPYQSSSNTGDGNSDFTLKFSNGETVSHLFTLGAIYKKGTDGTDSKNNYRCLVVNKSKNTKMSYLGLESTNKKDAYGLIGGGNNYNVSNIIILKNDNFGEKITEISICQAWHSLVLGVGTNILIYGR